MLPPLECLNLPSNDNTVNYEIELKQNATKLVDTLKSFGVETRIAELKEARLLQDMKFSLRQALKSVKLLT